MWIGELEERGGEDGAVDDLEDADAEPVVVAADLAWADGAGCVAWGVGDAGGEADDVVSARDELEPEGLAVPVYAAAVGRAVPDVGPVDKDNPH